LTDRKWLLLHLVHTDCVLMMVDIWRRIQVTIELCYSRQHWASARSVSH